MDTKILQYNLYRIYDRVMDGCYADVEVDYDLSDIAINGFTDKNLVVKNVSITQDYILKGPFDTKDIISNVKCQYNERDELEEDFCESLSESELGQISHLW